LELNSAAAGMQLSQKGMRTNTAT